MKATNYIYSILQYKHSQLLGEVLNVGILVYIPAVKQLSFAYPEKLIRLKFAYPDLSERTLKNYLRSFNAKIQSLNKAADIFADYDLETSLNKFIDNELIPQDASSLQFTESRKGLFYPNKYDSVISELYHSYLLAFDSASHPNSQIDEHVLLAKYKNLLKEFSTEKLNAGIKENSRIHFDYTLNLSSEKHFKFDVAWQNGSLNLVKPVSFDVIKPDTILNKAYRYFGQFTDIERYVAHDNYRFDLIVAEPQRKELQKAFKSAIEILEKPAKVNLVFEKDLPAYTQKTVDAIALFDE